jgi:hypothetical protein
MNYFIRLQAFEKKYHNLLVNMFKYMSVQWEKQETKYNNKIKMDYNSFVRYCFSVS